MIDHVYVLVCVCIQFRFWTIFDYYRLARKPVGLSTATVADWISPNKWDGLHRFRILICMCVCACIVSQVRSIEMGLKRQKEIIALLYCDGGGYKY